MRTLNQNELLSIHGAGNYSDLEVLGIASTGATFAGGLGYYMSYSTFSITEGLLCLGSYALPATIATSMVLGGMQAYHYFAG